jgi:hypothetical protein
MNMVFSQAEIGSGGADLSTPQRGAWQSVVTEAQCMQLRVAKPVCSVCAAMLTLISVPWYAENRSVSAHRLVPTDGFGLA